ncbi:MAG: site-specific integrase [Bacteriovoracaceae bacterium]|nr:site-specific integrase [Bacteriovoracaceae bacterium]
MDNKFEVKVYNTNSQGVQVSYLDPVTKKRKRLKQDSVKAAKKVKYFLESKFHQKDLSWFLEQPIADLITLHLERCPNTKLKDRRIGFDEFYEAFKLYKLPELNVVTLNNWFLSLEKKYNYSPSSLCHVKYCLNYFFKWLIDEGIMNLNPLTGVKLNRRPAKSYVRVIHSQEELKHYLELAKNYKKESFDLNYFHKMLYTAIHTGARLNELINLKWKNISFEKNTLLLDVTKNGHPRELVMSDHLRAFLSEMNKATEYVFTTFYGAKLCKSMATRHMQSFVNEHGIKKSWAWHSLRHSFAYWYLRSGAEMYQLQAILGHSTVGITIDVYGNVRAQDCDFPSPFNF